ncbi:cobalt-precorrin 5A hydrolase [Clostridium sp. AM58-1XD]|uniref:cobalt-precorrin 5A hydrolase n=1 Tax=Clostridium sp. AM58-1XD TaxID=2292307 RepID=UPI000E4E7AAF|nr:cobalt-precorrin 5A hydrolase [Clostridium sp. AM58-1XD]RGZ00587.1 hypothetical protein DXA13_03810 [Clostridium sp. AM58-1XD]
MKVAVISFTRSGASVSQKLLEALGDRHSCRVYIKDKFRTESMIDGRIENLDENAGSWMEKRFQDTDGIICVGAAGIAVRLTAPCLRDKMTDPAVVAVDEQGKFSIPLLSGHMGGANKLAAEAAEALGAVPVITTATDLNGKFAVDVFAGENGLILTDRMMAKEISARILEGERIGIISDFPIEGRLPDELFFISKEEAEKEGTPSIAVTVNRLESKNRKILKLIPRNVVLGIGCRKQVSAGAVWEAAERLLTEAGIDERSVCLVASIDKKADEPGIAALAERLGTEFVTFTAKELEHVPGEFHESEFVRNTVGTGNVCERAAVLAAADREGRYGRLTAGKIRMNGVTAAAAVKEMKIRTGRE